jgi:hypothetical protein
VVNAIAQIGGVALAPGVSRNGNLYTPEVVAGMVAEAQKQISSPDGLPITMLTHHKADDDSTRIVGRVTKISLDESGNARYQAEIAGTDHGRTIASLAEPEKDGKPGFLRGVSIRAEWDGARVERMRDGTTVQTGDNLRLRGLDFTHKPGVVAAGIDTFAWTDGGTKTETTDRVLVTESVEEALVAPITEETLPEASAVPAAFRAVVPESPHVLRDGECITCLVAAATESATPISKRGSGLQGGSKAYADPGYQSDKKQRYDLSTKANAKAAWSYINMPKNAKAYSANQLKRVKARIIKALKSFGVTVSTTESAGWSFDEPVAIDAAVGECYGGIGVDPERAGSWSLNASNGPVSLNLSSYGMDPAELDVILRAAADAACKALATLDPDMDGDIDVDGAPNADTDSDAGESDDPDGEPAESADPSPAEAPAPEPAAGTTENEEVPAMAETNEAAGTSTAAPALTQSDVDRAVATALAADREARRARKAAKNAKPAESAPAPAAPVAESGTAAAAPTPVTETEDQRIERMVAAKLAEQFPAETEDQRIERRVNEAFDAAIATRVQSGQLTPGRKGIVRSAEESVQGGASGALNSHGLPVEWPDKPIDKFTPDELDRYAGPILVGHYLGSRAGAIQ